MFYLIESCDRRNDRLYGLLRTSGFALRFIKGDCLTDLVLGGGASGDVDCSDCRFDGRLDGRLDCRLDGGRDLRRTVFGRVAVVYSPTRQLLPDEVAGIPSGAVVLGGRQSDDVLALLAERGLEYADYFDNEIFAIKHAALCAEGALSHIICGSDKSIYKTKILILGCGKTGRALAVMLGRLGVDVSMAAFDTSEFERSALFTERCFFGEQFVGSLPEFDVIINCSDRGFDESDLGLLNKNALFLQLSGGGISQEFDSLRARYNIVVDTDIPARFCMAASAEIMLECIHQKVSVL